MIFLQVSLTIIIHGFSVVDSLCNDFPSHACIQFLKRYTQFHFSASINSATQEQGLGFDALREYSWLHSPSLNQSLCGFIGLGSGWTQDHKLGHDVLRYYVLVFTHLLVQVLKFGRTIVFLPQSCSSRRCNAGFVSYAALCDCRPRIVMFLSTISFSCISECSKFHPSEFDSRSACAICLCTHSLESSSDMPAIRGPSCGIFASPPSLHRVG